MEQLPIVVLDGNDPLLVMGFAWLAILGMLGGGAVLELWRLMRRPERAPFFAKLERHGFTLVQAEEVVGVKGIAEAARRCASCGTRASCRRALRWSALGCEAPPCPNAAFFTRVRG
jgi:hypothetical protein